MSCEQCRNGGPVRLRTDSGIEIEFDKYCPYCGAYLPVVNLLRDVRTALGVYDHDKYVEVDGELLEIERRPTNHKPMNMKINLDNVNIDDELRMLFRMNRKEKKDDASV